MFSLHLDKNPTHWFSLFFICQEPNTLSLEAIANPLCHPWEAPRYDGININCTKKEPIDENMTWVEIWSKIELINFTQTLWKTSCWGKEKFIPYTVTKFLIRTWSHSFLVQLKWKWELVRFIGFLFCQFFINFEPALAALLHVLFVYYEPSWTTVNLKI